MTVTFLTTFSHQARVTSPREVVYLRLQPDEVSSPAILFDVVGLKPEQASTDWSESVKVNISVVTTMANPE